MFILSMLKDTTTLISLVCLSDTEEFNMKLLIALVIVYGFIFMFFKGATTKGTPKQDEDDYHL